MRGPLEFFLMVEVEMFTTAGNNGLITDENPFPIGGEEAPRFGSISLLSARAVSEKMVLTTKKKERIKGMKSYMFPGLTINFYSIQRTLQLQTFILKWFLLPKVVNVAVFFSLIGFDRRFNDFFCMSGQGSEGFSMGANVKLNTDNLFVPSPTLMFRAPGAPVPLRTLSPPCFFLKIFLHNITHQKTQKTPQKTSEKGLSAGNPTPDDMCKNGGLLRLGRWQKILRFANTRALDGGPHVIFL